MSRYVVETGLQVERVLCSPAARTRETLAGLALGAPPEVHFAAQLYNAHAVGYLEAIRSLGEDAPTLLVVGHNPAIEEVADILYGDGGPIPPPDRFPTAALAVIEFPRDTWDDIAPGSGRLVAFVTPRELAMTGNGP